MCGICGVAGDIYHSDKQIFRNLLYVSALRGIDSTGVGMVSQNGTDVQKDTWPAASFNFKYKNFYEKTGVKLLMGHCRDATVGTVSPENAHPYDTGNLISAMNGTLYGEHRKGNGKTDSENMFIAMETEGIKPVLDRIDPIDGYAVTIYDKKARTLHFARNSQRPLFVAVDKTYPLIYWASELSFLHAALRGHNKPKYDAYELQPRILYSIKLKKITAGMFDQVFEQVDIDEGKKSFSRHQGGWANWETDFDYGEGTSDVKKKLIMDGYVEFEPGRWRKENTTPTDKMWNDGFPDYGSDVMEEQPQDCCMCGDPIVDFSKANVQEFGAQVYYTCDACEQGLDRLAKDVKAARGQK